MVPCLQEPQDCGRLRLKDERAKLLSSIHCLLVSEVEKGSKGPAKEIEQDTQHLLGSRPDTRAVASQNKTTNGSNPNTHKHTHKETHTHTHHTRNFMLIKARSTKDNGSGLQIQQSEARSRKVPGSRLAGLQGEHLSASSQRHPSAM